MRILISDVGRDFKSSTIEVPDLADSDMIAEAIYREVLRMKALGSKGIETTWDSETSTGYVYAGAHCVGSARKETT